MDKIVRVQCQFGLFIGKIKHYDILGLTLTEVCKVQFIPERKKIIIQKIKTNLILSGNLLIEEALPDDDMLPIYIREQAGLILMPKEKMN